MTFPTIAQIQLCVLSGVAKIFQEVKGIGSDCAPVSVSASRRKIIKKFKIDLKANKISKFR